MIGIGLKDISTRGLKTAPTPTGGSSKEFFRNGRKPDEQRRVREEPIGLNRCRGDEALTYPGGRPANYVPAAAVIVGAERCPSYGRKGAQAARSARLKAPGQPGNVVGEGPLEGAGGWWTPV